MTMKFHHILWILVVVFVLGFSYLFYEVFLNGVVNPVLKFNTDPMSMPTDKLSYKPGEIVSVEIDVCKKRNIEATAQWALVDGFLVDYPSYTISVEPSCIKVWHPIGEVPTGNFIQKNDVVHVEGWVKYKLNDFNTQVYRLRSKEFTIE